MVRVAGLREQAFGDGAPQDYSPDGMRPDRAVAADRQADAGAGRGAVSLLERIGAARNWPTQGIRLLRHDELNAAQHETLDRFFRERAFPILTPMAVDPAHPSPRYHNRGLYLAAMLERRTRPGAEATVRGRASAAGVAAAGAAGARATSRSSFCWKRWSRRGCRNCSAASMCLSWTTFRITRDSDIELLEQESDDMLRLIEERLKARQRGEAVRLEVAAGGSEELIRMIIDEESRSATARRKAIARSTAFPARWI